MQQPHGLVYPHSFLHSLPVLNSNSDSDKNKNPIRVLSPSQFAHIHLQHTLAHPPDNVLFPFLHGLEGDNHAQTAFFSTSTSTSAASYSSHHSGSKAHEGAQHPHANPHAHAHSNANANARIVPKVPYYRGLVWVVCEDDLEHAGDLPTLRILRRKPAAGASSSPQDLASAQPFGLDDPLAGFPDDSSSSSSSSSSVGDREELLEMEEEEDEEEEEDDMSVYDDDIEEQEGATMKLNEDQREVRLMQRAQDAVDAAEAHLVAKGAESNIVAHPNATVSSCALPSPAVDAPTTTSSTAAESIKAIPTPASCASARRQSSASTSTTTSTTSTSPGLEVDTDHDADADEEEDLESLLASPVHIPMAMNVDVDVDVEVEVRVVQPFEGEGEGVGVGERMVPGVVVREEGEEGDIGSESLDLSLPQQKGKESYEGGHMHPVRHRPSPTLNTSATPAIPIPTTGASTGASTTANTATATAAGLGLGISPITPLSPSTPSSSTSTSASSEVPSVSSSLSSDGMGVGMEMDETSSPSSPFSTTSQFSTTSATSPSSPFSTTSAGSCEVPGPEPGAMSPLGSLAPPDSAHVQLQQHSSLHSQQHLPQHSQTHQTHTHLDTHSQTHHTHPHTQHSQTQTHQTHPHTHHTHPHPHPHTHTHPKRKKPSNPAEPPLFTSTFRPKELLRRVKVPLPLPVPVFAGAGAGKSKRGGTSATASATGSASATVLEKGVRAEGHLEPPVFGLGSEGGFGRLPEVSHEEKGTGAGCVRDGVHLESGVRPGGGSKDQGQEGTRVEGKQEKEQEEEEEGWEFVPARVPDGISLRNFGIQVPIYATLSDIVVYSPFGATPAAISLARRFRAAIRAKRLERLQAAGLLDEEGDEDDDGDEDEPLDNNSSPVEDTQNANDQQRLWREERRMRRREFLKYNVFVLDAVEDEMRKSVPYLMMRICGAGVPGGQAPHTCLQTASPGSTSDKVHREEGCEDGSHCYVDVGAHTNGPDGRTIELDAVEEAEAKRKRGVEDADMDVVADMELDQGEAMDVDVDTRPASSSAATLLGEKKKGRPRQHRHQQEDDLHLIPNTVDFALREREEMRDLTKASEIISLHPLPSSVPSLSPAVFVASPVSTPGASSSTPNLPTPNSVRQPLSAIYDDPERDRSSVWDPRVGQVFLGNSGDVPLAPDVPSHFRHAASMPRDADEAARWNWEALTGHLRGVDGLMKEYGLDGDHLQPEDVDVKESSGSRHEAAKTRPKVGEGLSNVSDDDPFNYVHTNDPKRGYGYDICVECHDLAPFPSTAHLRAADEHLGMLDVMWRERWERAWLAKEERRVHQEGGGFADANNHADDDDRITKSPSGRIRPPPPAPPRPPPHANAVIHLPFPSSPSNSQTTMVALMPVIRFLEKWIQPVPLPVPVVQPPPPPTTSETELKNLRMIESLDPKRNAAGASAGSPPPATSTANSRRWSSVTSLMPSFHSLTSLGGSNHHDGKDKEQQRQSHAAAPTPPPAASLPPHPTRMRSMTSPSFQLARPPSPVQARTRPLKILLYSSDGYTESSVPALCLLMAVKALMLPEAYLELQVEKRRSFFVFQADLGILRRVESRLKEEREREKEKERERERERERMVAGAYMSSLGSASGSGVINANGKRTAPTTTPTPVSDLPAGRTVTVSSPSIQSGISSPAASPPSASRNPSFMGRPAAKSVSFAHGHSPIISSASQYMQGPQVPSAPAPMIVPSLAAQNQGHSHHHPLTQSGTWPGPSHGSASQQIGFSTSGQVQQTAELDGVGIHGIFTSQPQPQQPMSTSGGMMMKGRPRASTSPWLPSLFGGDHQSWFNDPRFDGSFPSRVLPFLYLGNLNHAANVYMLHALGITHVVSVGECALVPPPHHMSIHVGGAGTSGYRPPGSSSGAHFVPGKGPGGHGSLWIEEREGRIKVLDIKGVCDDGIDTLEPQLEPICDWIDKARQDGGQVLVHCRVGVSRSATVTIAYVMKHLELPLVDAYLIVRSRRLSVLIQPNMRLLYNLCGWEIKLAKERADGDERKLKKELSRTLTWPYLAKEVHALNEKYLH